MSGMVFCRACGGKLHRSARSCPHCGALQSGSKNRFVAALLALFLGSFGIHKFYLGRVGQGFLYLIFCWTSIPGFIAFLEFFIYLFSSDEAFARKYG